MSHLVFVPVLILHLLLLINKDCDARVDLRILNGTAATNGMFPFAVYIAFKASVCTGSIITEQNVLSAAHCYLNITEGTTINDGFIAACLAGDAYLTKHNEDSGKGLQTNLVAKFIIHPNFIVGSQYDTRFDFSVSTLQKPFTFTEYVSAIPLATHDLTQGQSCITLGFGTQEYNNTEPVAADLAWFQTTATDIDCLGLGTTCTATPDKAAYYGDSGGPLIQDVNDPQVYGVLSAMRVLENPSAGSVFSGVPANRDWIIENSDLQSKKKHKRSGEDRIRENPLVFISSMQLVNSLC